MDLTNFQIWIICCSLEEKIEKWNDALSDSADAECWGTYASICRDIAEAKKLLKLFDQMQNNQ